MLRINAYRDVPPRYAGSVDPRPGWPGLRDVNGPGRRWGAARAGSGQIAGAPGQVESVPVPSPGSKPPTRTGWVPDLSEYGPAWGSEEPTHENPPGQTGNTGLPAVPAPMTGPPEGVAPLDEFDPRQLGPYVLLGRLGHGGMGSVYLAVRLGPAQPGGRRLVAIKVIRADLAGIPEFRARFLHEARAAQRVARFCTAAVLDVDTTGTRPYLVTEYIDGPTLSAHVRSQGPLPAGDLESLAQALATALRAIHTAGVIHRDLKPSNILLSRLGPRIIDFGIARALDATTMLTQGAIGTPSYMAPEQALGDPVTEAADIHAWGAVLLYAATGRAPFDGGSLPHILRRVTTDTPDLTALPDTLRPLIARATSKNPADRPTAPELLDLLQRLQTTRT
ncbi:serine/threonine-protein kinase [Pseudofrankia sp. DC12]|uniref:protein kinase domain-containing protein n=1 Tax=Pseudofrankia sp. DC12 TaxID=683315 RepID=UPI0006985B85